MARRLRFWVFVIGLAGGAVGLLHFSLRAWGRLEEYAIAGRQYRSVGKENPVDAPRLALRTSQGVWREPLEVPQSVFEAVQERDEVRIQIRRIPILGGEMCQYTLLRASSPVVEWNEGAPFFALSLGLGSLLVAVALVALFSFASAVFRWQAPSE